MAPPRESWTDERLDDLKEHMDDGFREVRGEIGQVRGEVVGLRVEIGQMREGLGEVPAEVKGINRTLQIGFGLIGSFLGVIGILIATQI